jgi:hypothetical protein
MRIFFLDMWPPEARRRIAEGKALAKVDVEILRASSSDALRMTAVA